MSRRNLIRIALEHPETRPVLLPLLTKQSSSKVRRLVDILVSVRSVTPGETTMEIEGHLLVTLPFLKEKIPFTATVDENLVLYAFSLTKPLNGVGSSTLAMLLEGSFREALAKGMVF